jgi:hypothetical protein
MIKAIREMQKGIIPKKMFFSKPKLMKDSNGYCCSYPKREKPKTL